MGHETTFYIFNENGIIESQELEIFCNTFINKTFFHFKIFDKKSIDLVSTIYKKFSSENLEYIIYDYGYVMKVEGDIKNSIILLKELDEIINNRTVFFVSPSQRVENSDESIFPHGANLMEIAQFLDKQFHNNEHTSALTNN